MNLTKHFGALVVAALAGWPGIVLSQNEVVRIALPKSLVFFPVFAAENLGLYADVVAVQYRSLWSQ